MTQYTTCTDCEGCTRAPKRRPGRGRAARKLRRTSARGGADYGHHRGQERKHRQCQILASRRPSRREGKRPANAAAARGPCPAQHPRSPGTTMGSAGCTLRRWRAVLWCSPTLRGMLCVNHSPRAPTPCRLRHGIDRRAATSRHPASLRTGRSGTPSQSCRGARGSYPVGVSGGGGVNGDLALLVLTNTSGGLLR
jgi:hypothetical protein